MSWLNSYSQAAESTDKFRDRADHLFLLSKGLFGEAGSILAELKKIDREAEAYPNYRQRLAEELGDFLWYYVRLVSLLCPPLLENLGVAETTLARQSADLESALDLGSAVGSVLSFVRQNQPSEIRTALALVWEKLALVASDAGVNLEEAGNQNLRKIKSRWPSEKAYSRLFDDNYPVEEQIPRSLTIDFIERKTNNGMLVLLRCNGIGIGDRVTDNIEDPDGYRFHDVFHMSHAVFLGWSPVMRSLLRCKRKSDPNVDENQDGARATIVEEAVSAIVFSRAKHMRFFEGSSRVDFDLLKNIEGFVQGYEIDQVPLWQWETAILEGYRVFRLLCANQGGRVSWDFARRTLLWSPLTDRNQKPEIV